MQKIQKMEAGKIYLIESTASANSVYFETDSLAKLFFRYCDYYLKDYLDVEEYVLNKDGWAMMVKVKSAQTIRKYYDVVQAARKSKEDTSDKKETKGIWWILSERVRLFISTYVRMSNKILGREGSLVRRKYVRYRFDSLEGAKAYVSKVRNDQHNIQQTKEKYQGFTKHFRMSRDVLTNPLRSSIWVETFAEKEGLQKKMNEIFGGEMPVMQRLGHLVVPKIEFDKTKVDYNPLKPPKL